jgi:hypothetical protein
MSAEIGGTAPALVQRETCHLDAAVEMREADRQVDRAGGEIPHLDHGDTAARQHLHRARRVAASGQDHASGTPADDLADPLLFLGLGMIAAADHHLVAEPRQGTIEAVEHMAEQA